jgi:hypothetical protein
MTCKTRLKREEASAMFRNTEGTYGKFILQELHDPELGTPEFRAMYNRFAKRVLWMDSDVMDGAFQMNTAWYLTMPENDPEVSEHVHEDCDEIIGFFGSDPANPYDLGAELEYGVAGETHLIDRTSMIFIPAGMSHNPMRFISLNRPVFHFSILTKGKYDRVEKNQSDR